MAGGGLDAPHPLAATRGNVHAETPAHTCRQGCAGIARGATGEGFGSGAGGDLGPEGGAGRAEWDWGWEEVSESPTAHRPSPGAGQGGDALRAAGRLWLPYDLRARRFAQSVSSLRLLFSPQPSPSRRRVTREALSAGQINGLGGIGHQGLRRAARGKTAPAPGCPAGEGKADWTLREIAACLCDSVRTGDASCAWPTVSRSSERRGRSLAQRKKVSHYSGTQAGDARESGMHLRWSGASGRLRGRNRRAHLLEATSRWSHIPQSLPDWKRPAISVLVHRRGGESRPLECKIKWVACDPRVRRMAIPWQFQSLLPCR